MSDNTEKLSPSLINPIAMPATGSFIGTPASIRASDVPQTVAIEEEPLDSVISETTHKVYGKFSALGKDELIALQANFPWPTSLRPVPILPHSPTEKGGKL